MKQLTTTIIFSFFVTFAISQKTGIIRGVVTYYHNEYVGDKPDLGADVWIIDSAKNTRFSMLLADSFYNSEIIRRFYLDNLHDNKPISERLLKAKEKLYPSEEYFKSLDERETKNSFLLTFDKKAEHRVVDAIGNYDFKVGPGTYYIYIKSKNRTGAFRCELLGKEYLKKVYVDKDETVDVSHNFGLL